MRAKRVVSSWVVYQMRIHGKMSGMNAVCAQDEWDAMEKAQPGHHLLIKSGISTEGEAEWLARVAADGSIAGNPPARKSSRP